jgi:CRP/FNR family transcriptional regulator
MVSMKELRDADLFRGLNKNQLQLLIKHANEEHFAAGEVIFFQGEIAQNLYVLLEGEVSLGVKAKDTIDMMAYSIEKRGEVFGLPVLIKPYRNNVSATCTKKVRAFSIRGEILRKLMKQRSQLGLAIMERVTEIYFNRLNSTRAMITNLFKMFKFQTGKSHLIETYYET